jgi:uncharacterized protein
VSGFFRPLVRDRATDHIIRNIRNERIIARHLIAAFDSNSRRTGLLRHTSFPPGSAMLIAPSNAVHTFFMRFAIDIAFVTREGKVVKICAAVPPWRIAFAVRAYGVVELPAGTLAASDTVAGDGLLIEPASQV